VQARARLKQLEAAPHEIGAVTAFGADPESRQLQVLIVGRAATAAEAEQLASTLGANHPALIAARTRLKEYNQRLNSSLDGLRRSVQAAIAEAQTQVSAGRRRLTVAAAEMDKIRQADPSLRQLEDGVEAKRRALTELEVKQKLSEGGRVEGGGFRIVSPARAPSKEGKTTATLLWSLLGGMIGFTLAIGGLGLKTILQADATTVGPTTLSVVEHHSDPKNALTKSVGSENPLIGSLPAIAPPRGLRSPSIAEAQTEVWRRPTSPYSLEVARIYETFQPLVEQFSPLTLLIAGTLPQCGASTFAANLARTAAKQSKRVLLIDAHRERPTLGVTIGVDTPKTLIKLGNRWRPLFRMQPYEHNLNIIPLLEDEDEICKAIAYESDYQRVNGIIGNFDFVILDGPDFSRLSELKTLVPVASKILLVSNNVQDIMLGAQWIRRLSTPPEKIAGYVGSSVFGLEQAA